MESFGTAGEWEMALELTFELNLDTAKRQNIAFAMADKCREAAKFSEAATILERYCNEVEEAVTCLISGHEWQRALRVARLNNRRDLISTDIEPAICDAATTLAAAILERRDKLVYTSSRLDIISTQRRLFPPADTMAHMRGEGGDGASEVTDTASLASSTASSRSYSSVGSQSRQRRGRARKIREGSPLEEEYLIGQRDVHAPTPSLNASVKQLMLVLLLFNKHVLATQLQGALDDLYGAAQAEEKRHAEQIRADAEQRRKDDAARPEGSPPPPPPPMVTPWKMVKRDTDTTVQALAAHAV